MDLSHNVYLKEETAAHFLSAQNFGASGQNISVSKTSDSESHVVL